MKHSKWCEQCVIWWAKHLSVLGLLDSGNFLFAMFALDGCSFKQVLDISRKCGSKLGVGGQSIAGPLS